MVRANDSLFVPSSARSFPQTLVEVGASGATAQGTGVHFESHRNFLQLPPQRCRKPLMRPYRDTLSKSDIFGVS